MVKRREAVSTDPRIQEILVSAAALFLEKGYANSSTTEIAARAKASKHTLYQHFGSKEDLFVAVVQCQMDLILKPFKALMRPHGSPRIALISVGEAVIRLLWMKEHLATVRIVHSELQHFPEMSRTLYKQTTQRVHRQVEEYLEDQTARGIVKITDAGLAAEQICSLMFGAVSQRRLMGVAMYSKKQEMLRLEQSVDLFLRGVR